MVKFKGKLFIIALVFLGLIISSQAMAAVCNVPSDRPTIQAAVSDGTCDPINVGTATYDENIVINRSLTLQSATPLGAVIRPTTTAPGWPSAVVVINADGVTVDGFEIDGTTVSNNGILGWETSGLTIKNNKIHGAVNAWDGCGILLFSWGNSGTVHSNLIENNEVYDTGRMGIMVMDHGADYTVTSGNTVTGNIVYDVWKKATAWNDGGGGIQINVGKNCAITNNVVYNVQDGQRGIYMFGSAAGNTITGNTLRNNPIGIQLWISGEGGTTINWGGETPTSPQVSYNSIYSNSLYGAKSTNIQGTPMVMDAEYNWWGDASGPGPVGPGTGDNVSLNVDYDPWLQIYWKDYNGQDPGGYMPDIDQNQDFDKVIVRHEESDPNITYSGQWTTYNVPGPSGGSIICSNDVGTPGSVSFTFSGTSIRWIEARYINRGISEVWIDGNLMTTVDAYGSLQWQQVLYSNDSLAPGQHTIEIKITGQHNPQSSDYYLCVDAFDVDDIEHDYCAPVAEANSLWWLNKKDPTLEIFGDPYTGTGYAGGDINGDGIADILDLVQELAIMMNTNQGHTGTTVLDEQAGIDTFLTKYGLNDKLYEHTVWPIDFPDWLPFFTYIEEEVERSQDVKLDLGFWHVDEAIPMGPGMWQVTWSRRGGHAVTVAGVDSQNLLLAISDPDNDAAEAGAPGVVRPGPHGYPHDPALHNNEMFASHDIYTVGPSPSPGGKMGLLNFSWKWNLPTGEWETVGPVPVEWTEPLYESMTFTEIEAAVIVSPIICGNGHVDPGEECDDGNLIPGDGCSPVCKLEVCGNGILDPQEECDDGNLINGDGCDDQCKIPDISVSPSSLAFGKVIAGLSSTSKTVTVKNDGNGKLKIGTISLGGTNPNQFSIPVADDHCSGQLVAPSLNCTVAVKFSPTSAGVKNATLSIPSDDPNENPASVSLSGNGVKVIVTSPNGGESWKSADGGYAITWLTSSTIAPAVATTKLLYTMDGGTTWKTISSFPGNPGTYNWYIPKVTVTKKKCKVKVVLKNAANTTIGSDMSDKFFTIKP